MKHVMLCSTVVYSDMWPSTTLHFLNSQGQGADGESAEGDHIKGGLGKKMKSISMTMRKKMGKKYARAVSEEMVSAEDESSCVVWFFFCSVCFFSTFCVNLSLESISNF